MNRAKGRAVRAVIYSAMLAGCLALTGCMPGDGAAEAEVDPTAAADAPVAGPDQTRPRSRPGKEAKPDPALAPPQAARTPDEADDLLPQPDPSTPQPLSNTEAADEAAEPAPEAEKPAPPSIPPALVSQQKQCTKAKGRFVRRSEGGTFVCVTPTRDANKPCDDSSDCEGICFAKSRTCAPVQPLFGCYDALENGRVVKICIE